MKKIRNSKIFSFIIKIKIGHDIWEGRFFYFKDYNYVYSKKNNKKNNIFLELDFENTSQM